MITNVGKNPTIYCMHFVIQLTYYVCASCSADAVVFFFFFFVANIICSMFNPIRELELHLPIPRPEKTQQRATTKPKRTNEKKKH